jgi:hypothetical protein
VVGSGTVGDRAPSAAEVATAPDAVTREEKVPQQTERKQAEEPAAAPAAFTGDPALLDEPDPWD